MQIGTQIKKYRLQKQLSQEELADLIYVSRQTISNWENDKNYPDIHSLVLLSTQFGISLDTLVKGDIEEMKKEINTDDIRQFNHDSMIFTCLFIATLLSPIPLFKLFRTLGIVVWGGIALITLIYANHIEKQKKQNDIQTYKEILAFTEGKKLDELEKMREEGKHKYQKWSFVLVFSLVAAILTGMMLLLFS